MKNYFLLALLVFLSLSCNKNLVGPVEDIPGSSNYEWTIDTTNVTYDHSLYRLYASSADDAWACGYGEVWHYNNGKWSKDQSVTGYSYDVLGGVDKENVWMAANGNYYGVDMFKYNGSRWSKFGHYEYKKVESYAYLNDVWGDSPNNIYGVGVAFTKSFSRNIGFILSYDGTEWKTLDLPTDGFNFYGIRRDTKGNGKYYIYGEQVLIDTTTNPVSVTNNGYKILEFNGYSLKEIFTTQSYSLYPVTIGGYIYFIGNNTIKKIQNGNFVMVKDFNNSEYRVWRGVGKNSKDMVLLCEKINNYNGMKYLVHYNGSELKEIFSTNGNIIGIQMVDDAIFAIVQTPEGKSALIRGKVKP